MLNKKPNPNCELCHGTGTISMDYDMDDVYYEDMKCECIKEDY